MKLNKTSMLQETQCKLVKLILKYREGFSLWNWHLSTFFPVTHLLAGNFFLWLVLLGICHFLLWTTLLLKFKLWPQFCNVRSLGDHNGWSDRLRTIWSSMHRPRWGQRGSPPTISAQSGGVNLDRATKRGWTSWTSRSGIMARGVVLFVWQAPYSSFITGRVGTWPFWSSIACASPSCRSCPVSHSSHHCQLAMVASYGHFPPYHCHTFQSSMINFLPKLVFGLASIAPWSIFL